MKMNYIEDDCTQKEAEPIFLRSLKPGDLFIYNDGEGVSFRNVKLMTDEETFVYMYSGGSYGTSSFTNTKVLMVALDACNLRIIKEAQ